MEGIRDRAAIVGIGQTPFGKALGRSEPDMAVEAIWNACADAGISPREIDGLVRYDMDSTQEEQLLMLLGRFDRCENDIVLDLFFGGHLPLDHLLVQQALVRVTGRHCRAMLATRHEKWPAAQVQSSSQFATAMAGPAVNPQDRGNVGFKEKRSFGCRLGLRCSERADQQENRQEACFEHRQTCTGRNENANLGRFSL